jgi:hypothetical protein
VLAGLQAGPVCAAAFAAARSKLAGQTKRQSNGAVILESATAGPGQKVPAFFRAL